jgi:hypothetical protein
MRVRALGWVALWAGCAPAEERVVDAPEGSKSAIVVIQDRLGGTHWALSAHRLGDAPFAAALSLPADRSSGLAFLGFYPHELEALEIVEGTIDLEPEEPKRPLPIPSAVFDLASGALLEGAAWPAEIAALTIPDPRPCGAWTATPVPITTSTRKRRDDPAAPRFDSTMLGALDETRAIAGFDDSSYFLIDTIEERATRLEGFIDTSTKNQPRSAIKLGERLYIVTADGAVHRVARDLSIESTPPDPKAVAVLDLDGGITPSGVELVGVAWTRLVRFDDREGRWADLGWPRGDDPIVRCVVGLHDSAVLWREPGVFSAVRVDDRIWSYDHGAFEAQRLGIPFPCRFRFARTKRNGELLMVQPSPTDPTRLYRLEEGAWRLILEIPSLTPRAIVEEGEGLLIAGVSGLLSDIYLPNDRYPTARVCPPVRRTTYEVLHALVLGDVVVTVGFAAAHDDGSLSQEVNFLRRSRGR